jgi:hypothetical protein
MAGVAFLVGVRPDFYYFAYRSTYDKIASREIEFIGSLVLQDDGGRVGAGTYVVVGLHGMLGNAHIHVDTGIEVMVEDGFEVRHSAYPMLGFVAYEIVIVALGGVDVVTSYRYLGVAAYKMYFVGMCCRGMLVMEVVSALFLVLGLDDESETVGFGKESGLVHFGFKEEGLFPLS